eukprot:360419-Chlamydomonas_euryale.AAC.2
MAPEWLQLHDCRRLTTFHAGCVEWLQQAKGPMFRRLWLRHCDRCNANAPVCGHALLYASGALPGCWRTHITQDGSASTASACLCAVKALHPDLYLQDIHALKALTPKWSRHPCPRPTTLILCAAKPSTHDNPAPTRCCLPAMRAAASSRTAECWWTCTCARRSARRRSSRPPRTSTSAASAMRATLSCCHAARLARSRASWSRRCTTTSSTTCGERATHGLSLQACVFDA